MKKLFVLAAVAVSMLVASCGGTAEKECEDYLKMVDSLNVEAEKAQTMEQVQKIYDEFQAKSDATINKLTDDDTASEEILNKVEQSTKKLTDVLVKKMTAFQQAAPTE